MSPISRKSTARVSISVCYLARDPNKQNLLANFLKSYKKFPAGIPHELVLLVKGDTLENLIGPNARLLKRIRHRVVEVPDTGFDIGSYVLAANSLDYDYFCFLNSYSQILTSNWLEFLVRPLLSNEAGLVGCTGSWASLATSSSHLTPCARFPHWRGIVHAYMTYPRYPNPHVRSTAFAVPRDLFRSLKIPELRQKEQAYRVESGYHSITRQVQKLGHQALIVNSSGKAFAIADWPKAGTFWIKRQEFLLVSDNQSRDYASSEKYRQWYLSRFAWEHPKTQYHLLLSQNKFPPLQLFRCRKLQTQISIGPGLQALGSTDGREKEYHKNMAPSVWRGQIQKPFFKLGSSENFEILMKISFELVPLMHSQPPAPRVLVGTTRRFRAIREMNSMRYNCYVQLAKYGEPLLLILDNTPGDYYFGDVRIHGKTLLEIFLHVILVRPRRLWKIIFQCVRRCATNISYPFPFLRIIGLTVEQGTIPIMNADFSAERRRKKYAGLWLKARNKILSENPHLQAMPGAGSHTGRKK